MTAPQPAKDFARTERRPGMAGKVLDTLNEHPSWTSGDIARHVGCEPAYVRATLKREREKNARKDGRPEPVFWADMDREERREACLAGRKAGLSTSQIAAPLRATRNSVIGILKRLKDSGVRVPASPHGPGSNPGKHSAKPAAVPEKRPEPKPARVHGAGVASAVRARMVPPENRPALPVERKLASAPVSRNLSLMDLSDRVCRYPHDDPRSPSFGFCGAATDGNPPYCGYHTRIVYQPLASRQRGHQIATATLSSRKVA